VSLEWYRTYMCAGGRYSEIVHFMAGGTYSYHWVLEGINISIVKCKKLYTLLEIQEIYRNLEF